jgi:hypothetical protein
MSFGDVVLVQEPAFFLGPKCHGSAACGNLASEVILFALMEPLPVSCLEILDRLSHVLPAVFNAYRVPEDRARKIVEEACFTLISKQRLASGNHAFSSVRNTISSSISPN